MFCYRPLPSDLTPMLWGPVWEQDLLEHTKMMRQFCSAVTTSISTGTLTAADAWRLFEFARANADQARSLLALLREERPGDAWHDVVQGIKCTWGEITAAIARALPPLLKLEVAMGNS